jgi:hypothetical protein
VCVRVCVRHPDGLQTQGVGRVAGEQVEAARCINPLEWLLAVLADLGLVEEAQRRSPQAK